ncbi:CRISPR-associated helicase/endonuclease Cas3 [Desulfolucanica intricata]|uniref:CRISPR-associated helicase/endonuclease Cas3 n=1 Tax=Desulfolucanica intricata TaxID=1285191 RepID=UPI000830F381|nr:CRISPR-associated helicase/endonuclease Cas3 [Desulfolucanica intricata]
MSELLAKKAPGRNIYQTFAGHTIDGIKVLARYLNENNASIQRFSRDFRISHEELCHILFLTLFLHDIGKATYEFQKNIITGQVKLEISHPFFAMPFVQSDLPYESELLLRTLVLSHHNQLYDYIFRRVYIRPKVNYCLEEISEFIHGYRKVYHKHLKDLFNLKYFPIFNPSKYLHNDNLREHIFSIITNTRLEVNRLRNKKRIKAIYCYLLSIVKYCDQQSSKVFSEKCSPKANTYGELLNPELKLEQPIKVLQKALASTVKTIIPENTLRTDKFNLILAPINSLRRKIAVEQALHIAKREHRSRIIYVLPYQLASEQIFDWLKNFFGPANVGLIHTMSYYVKEQLIPNELKQKGDRGRDTARELRYGDRIFDKPVTITTIDHLIYTMVHGYKQSDFALGKLLNAVIIFDGFNPNSQPALRYLADCIKLLYTLKIPCLGVTSFVPGQFKETLYNSPFCEIFDLHNNKQRVVVKVASQQLKDNLEKIVSLYREGKRQLVYCDNVFQAQKLYLRIKKLLHSNRVFLCHSIFNSNDRFYAPDSKGRQFEGLNNSLEPWIIVTTQALLAYTFDVNCNVVHSGTEPVECLLHRINNLYHPKRGEEQTIYIYPSQKGINPDTNWNRLHNQKLSFTDIAKLYYKGNFPKELRAKTNLNKVFNYCTLFGYSPDEVRQADGNRKLIQMWNETQYKMDVIPECLWDPIFHKNPELANRYYIKLPYYWYLKYPQYFYHNDGFFESFMICKLPYDSEMGIDLKAIGPAENRALWI